MRRLIVIAAVTLGLAGCGSKTATDDRNAFDDNLTADSIVSNDVTAIDAVTGDAANMAADSDMNFGGLANADSNALGDSERPSRPPAKKFETKAEPANAAEPVPNAATNAQ